MIKTNIKMRVTPEQNLKVQLICMNKGFTGDNIDTSIYARYLFIHGLTNTIQASESREHYKMVDYEEIDPELFIITYGACIENPNKDKKIKQDLRASISNSKLECVNFEYENKAKNPNSKHYELWEDFEAIDVIKLALTDEEYKGFLKGNILKYRLRVGKKDDVSKEIEKIKDYERELNK